VKLGSDEHLLGKRFLDLLPKEPSLLEKEGIVGVFAEAMRNKLDAKSRQGFTGWADKRNRANVLSMLQLHVERQVQGEDQTVDIANLAMMLYYMDYQK